MEEEFSKDIPSLRVAVLSVAGPCRSPPQPPSTRHSGAVAAWAGEHVGPGADVAAGFFTRLLGDAGANAFDEDERPDMSPDPLEQARRDALPDRTEPAECCMV